MAWEWFSAAAGGGYVWDDAGGWRYNATPPAVGHGGRMAVGCGGRVALGCGPPRAPAARPLADACETPPMLSSVRSPAAQRGPKGSPKGAQMETTNFTNFPLNPLFK